MSAGRSLSPTPSSLSSPPVSRVAARKSRVITTPSWARNLPAEFPDDGDNSDPYSETSSPSHAPQASTSTPRVVNGDVATQSNGSDGNHVVSMDSSSPPPPPGRRGPASQDLPSSSTSPQPPLIPPLSSGADRWWTFTIPAKYLAKVQDHQATAVSSSSSSSSSPADDHDASTARGSHHHHLHSHHKDEGDGEKPGVMRTHLPAPNFFSSHHASTPTWASPWTPFRPLHHTPADPFPFSTSDTVGPAPARPSAFQLFLLQNPLTPLLFRFLNLAFSTCTLAIASHMRLVERGRGVLGVMGSSTLMAIVVCPLAMVHIFFNLYAEYFGQPIGLWSVSTKMAHTLIELVFICLFSSLLSLCFDDLLTSPLHCVPSSNSRWTIAPTAVLGDAGLEGTVADQLCRRQAALVALVFSSVALYIAILVVSLLRIFHKVTTRK